MKDLNKPRKKKLLSAAAMILSATVLLGGSAVRSRVSAGGIPPEYTVQKNTCDVGQAPVTVGTNADGVSRSARSIAVFIDGKAYSGRAFLYKETTYVGFREFATELEKAKVSWSPANSTAMAKTAKTTISAVKGKEYISANGRYIWARTGIIIKDGTMYVPVRALCTAFGASLTWNAKTYTVNIKRGNGTITSGSVFYDPDEVYWLSKIIHAESRGEPMTGKIAVGNVVLNRVGSKDYPNTIYGVIFDKKYGVQFSPVADGSIKLTPDADSVIAAKLCLEGYTVSSSILFFINKNIAENMWVTGNRPLAVSIGKHDFYA